MSWGFNTLLLSGALLLSTSVVVPTIDTLDPGTADYANRKWCGGEVTDTGGDTITRRGICYKVGTSGDPTTSDSTNYEDGSFGIAEYYLELSGLLPNTSYRIRAYAVNSAGTGYGVTYQITTTYTFLFTAPYTPYMVGAWDASWSTVRGKATGDSAYESVPAAICQLDTGTYSIYRGFICFDTSELLDYEIAFANIVQENGGAPIDDDSTSLHIVESTQADVELAVVADFDAVGSTSFGSVDLADILVDPAGYNYIALNASGLANINTAGWSKFATRLGLDLNNSAPTGNNRSQPYSVWLEVNVLIQVNLNDSISLSDIATKSSGKPASETINLADSLANKSIRPVKADTVSLSDSRINTLSLPKSDSISLSDSRVNRCMFTKSDSISISDEFGKLPRKVCSDIINLSDALDKKAYLSLSDLVSLIDEVVSILKIYNVSLSDTINLSDNLSKTFSSLKADSINLSDLVSKVFSTIRYDTISLTDEVLSKVLLVIWLLNLDDSISLSDTQVLSIGKNMSDSISLSDDYSKIMSILKTDTSNLLDERVFSLARTIADSISLSDARSLLSSKLLSDSLSLSDLRISLSNKLLSDEVDLTDDLVLQNIFARFLSDTVSLSDSIAKKDYSKVLSDSVSLIDSALLALTWKEVSLATSLITLVDVDYSIIILSQCIDSLIEIENEDLSNILLVSEEKSTITVPELEYSKL